MFNRAYSKHVLTFFGFVLFAIVIALPATAQRSPCQGGYSTLSGPPPYCTAMDLVREGKQTEAFPILKELADVPMDGKPWNDNTKIFSSYEVGKMYADGVGVSPDQDLAIKYLKFAADNYLEQAGALLAQIAKDNPTAAIDPAERLKLLTKTATTPEDFYSIAKLADVVNGLAASPQVNAAYYREKACNGRIAEGCFDLWKSSQNAWWLQLAANLNHAEAKYLLGVMQLKDAGADGDLSNARRYLDDALNLGYAAADAALAELATEEGRRSRIRQAQLTAAAELAAKKQADADRRKAEREKEEKLDGFPSKEEILAQTFSSCFSIGIEAFRSYCNCVAGEARSKASDLNKIQLLLLNGYAKLPRTIISFAQAELDVSYRYLSNHKVATGQTIVALNKMRDIELVCVSSYPK